MTLIFDYFYSPHYYTRTPYTHVHANNFTHIYKVWSPSIITNNGSDRANGNTVPSTDTLLPQRPNDVLKLITEASSAVQMKWANNHQSDPVRFHFLIIFHKKNIDLFDIHL